MAGEGEAEAVLGAGDTQVPSVPDSESSDTTEQPGTDEITIEADAVNGGPSDAGGDPGSEPEHPGEARAKAARVDLPQRDTTEVEAVAAAVAAAPAQLDEKRVSQAVVRVETAIRIGDDLSIVAFGSGSIIDASGLILTNYHVVDPAIGYDLVVIAVTDALDRTPAKQFLAEIAVSDPALDLAVLQLVSDLSGTAVKANTLGLTVLPLGDSDSVQVLDRIGCWPLAVRTSGMRR
jgi:S1-C subfamily serine protease